MRDKAEIVGNTDSKVIVQRSQFTIFMAGVI